jgi:hypothetical protein
MLIIHLSAPVSVANRVEEVLIVAKRKAQVSFDGPADERLYP